jgi:cyclohexanecarboxylate-CoA ligase
MKFDPILPKARVEAMRAQRHWGDELLVDHLDRCVAQAPDKTAIVDFNSMQGTGRRLNYREFGDLVDRIAVGLSRIGIGKDDVVSCQLPNWWQFGALAFACWRIGAVINPMMPIFREREVKFMLGFAKRCSGTAGFRGFDHPPWCGHSYELSHLNPLVVGGSGEETSRGAGRRPQRAEGDAQRLFAARHGARRRRQLLTLRARS